MFRRFFLVVLLPLALTGVTLLPHLAFAQDLEDFGATTRLSSESLPIIIARLIRAFLGILGIISVLILLYGGYLYLTANGDPKPIQQAQKVFRAAGMGLLIILSSYALTSFILGRLLGAITGTSAPGSSSTPVFVEPLSGALGGGILESHYPPRGALDMPRNVRIMVTFVQAVNPASIITDFNPASPAASSALNTDNILIYRTEEGEGDAFASDQVVVTHTDDFRSFVFDPLPFLGNADADTNYTVELGPGIEWANGSDAFTGAYRNGYAWTFEVSTELDLTPPQVSSVVPVAASTVARNIILQINFSEAMDPVSASGLYNPSENEAFSHVTTSSLTESPNTPVSGEYRLSNQYRTVEFQTLDACGVDPCGGTIFCLPGPGQIRVEAHAADVGASAPQALVIDGAFNGLVDAAGNSLDGDGDGEAAGQGTDDYAWQFGVTGEVNDEVPRLLRLSPSIWQGDVDVNEDPVLLFSAPLQPSTINSSQFHFVPGHRQELWYTLSSSTILDTPSSYTQVTIDHGALWDNEPGDPPYVYYPIVEEGVRSAYQICLYPTDGPNAQGDPSCYENFSASQGGPYCCSGRPSNSPCENLAEDPLLP